MPSIKNIKDKELAHACVGCPDYTPINLFDGHKLANEILIPIFNEFQLEKYNNNIKYYQHHMLSRLSKKMRYYTLTDKMKEYLRTCVSNYYKLFKSNFYKRYQVLSFTTPYDTNIIPLEYNINGSIDLIIKTSYGVTLLNYVYNFGDYSIYYNIAHSGTRLQIAGRCLKLITGDAPDLLCNVVFHKKNVTKHYFKYLNQRYEDQVQILDSNLLPIRRNYCELCANCSQKGCSPWKTKGSLLF